MKVLQLDVDNITYELVKPEARIYEESDEKSVSVNGAIVMLVSVEKNDTEETARRAISDTLAFIKRQKIKKLVIYPFAHLSNNLAAPADAMKIFDVMYTCTSAENDIEVTKAPFGWNKKLCLAIKGYPLAEQSRSYGSTGAAELQKKS